MKKTMYLLGYLAVFLMTTGLLFKLQHWPGAAIMLTIAIALFNFGFLPLFIYGRYKRTVHRAEG
jgi:predicted RND superfamily exporter protein